MRDIEFHKDTSKLVLTREKSSSVLHSPSSGSLHHSAKSYEGSLVASSSKIGGASRTKILVSTKP